jgi:hypothetical protein
MALAMHGELYVRADGARAMSERSTGDRNAHNVVTALIRRVAKEAGTMKKVGAAVAVGAVVAGAAFIAKHSRGGVDFERIVERMPENAPPKWIFRNVTAVRENTERILQILESERASG